MKETNVMALARAGKLNIDELRSSFESESSADVSVEGWEICYSAATGQLSEFCTVRANDPGDPINGVGMIAYSADGSIMYAVQYTNEFTGSAVATSIGTTRYSPSDGNQALCIVYGTTTSSSFFFIDTLTIGSC